VKRVGESIPYALTTLSAIVGNTTIGLTLTYSLFFISVKQSIKSAFEQFNLNIGISSL
jgi:hypothetical protein